MISSPGRLQRCPRPSIVKPQTAKSESTPIDGQTAVHARRAAEPGAAAASTGPAPKAEAPSSSLVGDIAAVRPLRTCYSVSIKAATWPTAIPARRACLRLGWTSALLLRTLLGKDLGAKLDALIADVHTGSRYQPFDLGLALAAERAQQLIWTPIMLRRWCGRIFHMAPGRPPNDCEMTRQS